MTISVGPPCRLASHDREEGQEKETEGTTGTRANGGRTRLRAQGCLAMWRSLAASEDIRYIRWLPTGVPHSSTVLLPFWAAVSC